MNPPTYEVEIGNSTLAFVYYVPTLAEAQQIARINLPIYKSTIIIRHVTECFGHERKQTIARIEYRPDPT